MADQSVLTASPEVLGGAKVFAGTRVPVENLLDYLKAGQTVDEFLDDFPSVSRAQVAAVLQLAGELLVAGAGPT